MICPICYTKEKCSCLPKNGRTTGIVEWRRLGGKVLFIAYRKGDVVGSGTTYAEAKSYLCTDV